jgi:hypothetical protein
MDEDSLSERAQKIDPRYSVGEPVLVATGRNQSEAEMISGLLLEEGIPSLIRRSRGFDVPDMLAAGRRDLLVAQSAEAAARDVLLQSELADSGEGYRPAPLPILAGLLGAIAVVGLVLAVVVLISG